MHIPKTDPVMAALNGAIEELDKVIRTLLIDRGQAFDTPELNALNEAFGDMMFAYDSYAYQEEEREENGT